MLLGATHNGYNIYFSFASFYACQLISDRNSCHNAVMGSRGAIVSLGVWTLEYRRIRRI